MDCKYVYTVELWNNDLKMWELHTRFYAKQKQMTDFDLRTIYNKRRNATFKGILT